MTTFTPAPVYTVPPRKPIHPGIWIAALFGSLVLGFGVGGANKANTAVPAPTSYVTTTATATTTSTVTVAPVSKNVANLKAVWVTLDQADQDSIRSSWRTAKGTSNESRVIATLMAALLENAPTLTASETKEFLDWTLTH